MAGGARRWRADAGGASRRPRAYGRAARVHAPSGDGDQRPSAMVPLTLASNRAQTLGALAYAAEKSPPAARRRAELASVQESWKTNDWGERYFIYAPDQGELIRFGPSK